MAMFRLGSSLLSLWFGLPTCLASAACSSWSGDEIAYLQSHATMHPQSFPSGQSLNVPQPSSAGQPAARWRATRPMAWIHVAKCGSSLQNALLYLPGMCPNLPPGLLFETVHADHQGYAEFVTDLWCQGSFSAEGRTRFNDHSGIGGIYRSSVKGHGIIMLRQPEQRLLSAYYDNQHSWPLAYYGRDATDVLEFAQVVSGCAVRMLTREFVSNFPHHGEPCSGPTPASAAEVTLAKQRLREGFVFVGLTDEWDLSICLLHAAFGGSCRASDWLNTNPGTNASSKLYDTSELMGYKDVPDGMLYEEASRLFLEQLQRYGLSHSACQPCFKQALSAN